VKALEAQNGERMVSTTIVWNKLEKDKSVERKKKQNRNPGSVLIF
jgi:hypothetical protein